MTTERRMTARGRVVALAGFLADPDRFDFAVALDDFERESQADLLAAAKAALENLSWSRQRHDTMDNDVAAALRAAIELAEGVSA